MPQIQYRKKSWIMTEFRNFETGPYSILVFAEYNLSGSKSDICNQIFATFRNEGYQNSTPGVLLEVFKIES